MCQTINKAFEREGTIDESKKGKEMLLTQRQRDQSNSTSENGTSFEQLDSGLLIFAEDITFRLKDSSHIMKLLVYLELTTNRGQISSFLKHQK